MSAAVIIPAYNPDEELVSLTEQLWERCYRIIFRKKGMKKKITAFSYAEAVPYARHQDVQSGC